MFNEEYILVPLRERRDLCSDCITLLNQEWPRSVGARENTLRKSLNSTPPMSYVLIDQRTDKLVGHARLCPLPTEQQGCWIESVIVSNELRGKGLGRWLMEQLEDEARKYGFKKAYLSSEDKQAFYEKCGYVCSEPVLNVGANTALFERFNTARHFLQDNLHRSSQKEFASQKQTPVQASKSTKSATSSNAKFVAQPPPPPPPPPPPLSVPRLSSHSSQEVLAKISNNGNKKTQYMCKVLN